MHPALAKLLSLQATQQEILRLERQRMSLPAEKERRRAELEALRKTWEENEKEVKRRQVEADKLDLEVRAREGEMAKLEVRLNEARSNSEYTAIQNQIKSYKEMTAVAEDRALELYEKVEELQALVAEEKSQLEEQEGVFQEFLKSMAEEEARIDRETQRLRAHLLELEAEADPEALLRYGQLMNYFANHGGVVLCPVVAGVCTACGSRILPNDEVKLLRGIELVQCKACSRILYLPNR